ncbi:DNA polymerase delta subunit 3 isoform X3 [Apus apus]|nr:DNA polymerase delta subunit 3 isoform X3 [Apus apus]
MKSKLAKITSVHIYSLQKALLKDSGPLYNTDYDIVKTNLHNCTKFSAIRCAAAVPRASAEGSQAQTSAQAGPLPPSDTSAGSVPVANGHAPATTKQTSQQPRGIMGMFAAKAASKPQDTNKETKAEAKEAPGVSAASTKPPAKGNIMNNFFGKAAMNKLKVSSVPEQPKEEKEVVKPSVPGAEPESSPNGVVEKAGKKTESARSQQKDKKSKTKRLDKSDNEEERDPENVKKKRKRIKQLQSDSSDEEAGIPPSPTPEEEKSPPPVPALKAELGPSSTEASAGGRKRKRKRVLKSKMFIDEEEGCMVTEKVYESESCTDSEDDFKSKPPPAAPKQPLKKESKEERKNLKKGAATASRANKQVSIMGFFQKK